ncbi:hypothetical protein GCM10010441_02070 [Kitasatospora paracochleata]|uniref:Uncharacterized protein n=1 Tax=Kitasatospora paracochleata TaxID=58354 RepID=A0ABT1J2S9_9ACTN|nr:hypothetical protein [Kitasatospora paracochleata]MCP2311673.1 hypothetical protein [Kitasatospora paracochleata]
MGGFDEVADRLYALSPRAFTAARDEAAARARSEGDRELAARIKALRRPTLSAFAVNRLVRSRPDEVEPLADLGRALREAQAQLSGPVLRELSGQRHRVVAALTEQARRAAAEAGERLAEAQLREVEQTLRAALASEDAAAALAGGRLIVALEETSDLPAGETAPPGKPETAPAPKPKTEPKTKAKWAAALKELRGRVAQAEAALATATGEQREADRAAQRLADQVERLAGESGAAGDRVDRARTALERAEGRLQAAREAERARRDEHGTARRRAAEAEEATEEARTELDRSRARLAEAERDDEG